MDTALTWQSCHPGMRDLLLDSVVWDLTEDASPNATQEGYEALEAYVAARETPDGPSADDLLDTLLERKGVADIDPDALERDVVIHDDVVVGVAFASLKVDGLASPAVLKRAIESIERQNDPAMITIRQEIADPERFVENRQAMANVLECALLRVQ